MKFMLVVLSLELVVSLKYGRSSEKWPCKDEELACKKMAAQFMCYGLTYDNETDTYVRGNIREAFRILSLCRESCKFHYDEFGHLLGEAGRLQFLKMGGANDTVYDPLGYEHEVCDLSKGMYHEPRLRLLFAFYSYHGLDQLVEHHRYPPKFTEMGFQKDLVPRRVWGDIQDFYKNTKKKSFKPWINEPCDIGMHNCATINISETQTMIYEKTTCMLMELPEELAIFVHKALKPAAEKWSKTKLNPTRVYGIRRYKRGAWMAAHVDALETHVVSIIINVAQKVDEPWPLDIVDHNGHPHNVFLKPGEMVFYESLRLAHGRVQPLKGKYYDNLFIHYQPMEWALQ